MADNAMKWEEYGKNSYKARGDNFQLEVNLYDDGTFAWDLKAKPRSDCSVSTEYRIDNIDDLETEISNAIGGLLDQLRSIKRLASKIHTLKFGRGGQHDLRRAS